MIQEVLRNPGAGYLPPVSRIHAAAVAATTEGAKQQQASVGSTRAQNQISDGILHEDNLFPVAGRNERTPDNLRHNQTRLLYPPYSQ